MSYSDGNSYEEILARCLSSERLTNIDKRPGSIIYDALAPLCLELAEAYIQMDIMNDQSYLLDADGENLDRRVYDYGIVRNESVKTQKIGIFKCYQIDENTGDYVIVNGEKQLVDMDVPIGSRFSVPNNADIVFVMKEKRLISGVLKNIIECESGGSLPNTYSGTILPITPILNLVKAEAGNTVVSGEDRESDEELRQRAIEHLNYIAFGGNIEDYIEKVDSIQGVAAVKVFPAYIDPKQVVLAIKTNSEAPTEQVSNMAEVLRVHSKYRYVGTGNGDYELTKDENDKLVYEQVGEGETGDYESISSSVEITNIRQPEFDGSVKISVLGTGFVPMSAEAIAEIQEAVDPPDNSGNGYGIAPIGHYVTVVTPTESTLAVQIWVTVGANTTLADETDGIKQAIIDYVNSVRAQFAQDVTLEVTVSGVITVVRNNCPNVTDVVLVEFNGQEGVTKVVYTDTAENQYIPKTLASNITVSEVEGE